MRCPATATVSRNPGSPVPGGERFELVGAHELFGLRLEAPVMTIERAVALDPRVARAFEDRGIAGGFGAIAVVFLWSWWFPELRLAKSFEPPDLRELQLEES